MKMREIFYALACVSVSANSIYQEERNIEENE